MDMCGFVLLHCMFCMLRGQNLPPLNCGVSFETLIFMEISHFIEYKVLQEEVVSHTDELKKSKARGTKARKTTMVVAALTKFGN